MSDSTEPPTGRVTRLLTAWSEGDETAHDELWRLVYGELRGIARRRLAVERDGHSIGPTALVNEAYLRLVDLERIEWRDRGHFFAMAARAMRRILVDHARKRRALKRGGDRERVTLEDVPLGDDARIEEVLALDEALDRLEEREPRMARVVEARVFSGLTVEETAGALSVSTATVKRDWRAARAWLNRELEGSP